MLDQAAKDQSDINRRVLASRAMEEFFRKFWREYSPPPPATTLAKLVMTYARPILVEPNPLEPS